MDFLKIQENLKKLKKTEKDLNEYLNDTLSIEKVRNNLLTNSSEKIVYKLKFLDYKKLENNLFSKIAFLLKELEQRDLDDYRDFLKQNYIIEVVQEKPKQPEVVSKTNISKYNEDLKIWNRSIDETKTWNRNYKFLLDTLNDIITLDLYGDTSLNNDDLSGVYFVFYETVLSEIEVFIQEMRNSPSETVQKIKKVEIVDISSHVPNEISLADEVLFYFDSIENAEAFKENSDVAYGVYEKYIIRNDTMKKIGGEWGLESESERKQNFAVSTPFKNNPSTHSVIKDDSLSTIGIFEDNYEIGIEECIYSEKVYEDGSMVFIIQPSKFFEEYETILNNPKLIINGITDDKNWYRRDDNSYSYRNGYSRGLEFLDENSLGYDSKLDDIVIQIEKSVIENMTEDEVYEMYVEGSSNFKPYDLEFDFSLADKETLHTYLYPSGKYGFKHHLKCSKDVYDDFTLEQIMDSTFTILCESSNDILRINPLDIEKAYNFLTSIGIKPRSVNLLEEILEKI
jgi:hypothetical protein